MSMQRIGPHVRIEPGGPVSGRPSLPGSKSLTNRYLVCAALADGRSTLRGVSLADDGRLMIHALRSLGIRLDCEEATATVVVEGCRGHIPADSADLDAGAAGTVMRFLAALACLGRGRFRLDGSQRMRERPIGMLVDALRDLGAAIGYESHPGYPPLTIAAGGLSGGTLTFKTPPSSQFISALLMVAPYAADDVLIAIDGGVTSRPYLEMTLAVMRSMGVELVEHELRRFVVPAPQCYIAGTFAIEPDASAATYFWAAAAITGGRVRVEGLSRGSAQGDVGFVDVLERMGCQVRSGDDYLEVQGPPRGELRGVQVDLNEMPDTVQTLAVAALFARGPTRIDNVANLRIKETDRIAALAAELTKLGAEVDSREDGLTVTPPPQLRPAELDTYDDHRMAMSLALAGLAGAPVVIRDAGCVSKSFPGYFDVLASVRRG